MKKQLFSRMGAVALAVALTACGTYTLSEVDKNGHTDKPVFPKISEAMALDYKDGTVVNEDIFVKLIPGLTRDQVYHLLGRPHFAEGFRAREWDYILHLAGSHTGVRKTCQLKVLYDKDKKAQSYHWLPTDCMDAEPAPASQSVRLSADALFDFDSSTLRAGAEPALDDLVSKIKQHGITSSVAITGYTDRLGSTDYNQRLSLARAQTVRDYLVQTGGIEPGRIRVAGRGEANPVSSCAGGLSRSALIRCLQPDRRVEVTIGGSGN